MAVSCPPWLANHLQQVGGVATFRQYMDWSLNDPEHGFYGSGQVRLGPKGDFVTSPSLGTDFGELLARQVIAWLQACPITQRLSIVEIGPGDGDLAAALIEQLKQVMPDRLDQLELVLVEHNPAMRQRQQTRLAGETCLAIRWCSLEQLRSEPRYAVVLAHELLDALPIDRLICHQQHLQLVGVALRQDGCLEQVVLPLPVEMAEEIEAVQQRCGFQLPPAQAPEGWTTEWHSSLLPWYEKLSAAIDQGLLLVIDYALEAHRYYNARRAQGTLMTYSNQQAGCDPLHNIAGQDLTAHLCIETVNDFAIASGWQPLASARQGEVLLALGLAERLYELQSLPAGQLPEALRRREALLRLVDPAGLGEFRWLLFGKGDVFKDMSFAMPADIAQSPLR